MTSLSLLLISLAAPAAVPGSVLLDFSAEWCGPCQQMSPIVSRLQRQGHPIRKVDVDKEPGLAREFGITSIPAFVLVVNGKEVERVESVTSESRLRRMLTRIPQSEMAVAAPAASSKTTPAAGASAPQVKLAQDQPKSKSLFQIPFFGKDDEEESGPVVFNETPTIRANPYDEQRAVSDAQAQDPLVSSTRIRVKDRAGVNFGSGTIISSQTGRTLVLTCGHIFRDLPDDATIEVDVFYGDGFEMYVGELVNFDLEADVGLISIGTAEALPTSRMASTDQLVSTSDRVFSIGCGGGEPPSKESLVVTALNRYEGPHNIECTGVPKQGRSGGGLFNPRGEVIGVCIAADPKEKRGLYAGFQAIRAHLEASGLGHLYRGAEPPFESEEQPALADAEPRPAAGEEAYAQGAEDPAGLMPTSRPLPGRSQQPRPQASPAANLDGLGESEVICIIRPLDGNQSASRVVVINRASPKFLSFLTNELGEQPHPTTASVRYDELESGQEPVASAGLRSLSGGPSAPTPRSERFKRYSRSEESR